MKFVTIALAAAETGYTINAINRKIDEGVWPEGQLWRKAPDGRRLVDLDAYTQWVISGQQQGISRTPRRRSPRQQHPDQLDGA